MSDYALMGNSVIRYPQGRELESIKGNICEHKIIDKTIIKKNGLPAVLVCTEFTGTDMRSYWNQHRLPLVFRSVRHTMDYMYRHEIEDVDVAKISEEYFVPHSGKYVYKLSEYKALGYYATYEKAFMGHIDHVKKGKKNI